MTTSPEYKANSLKTAQAAIKSFESATGKKVYHATSQDLEAWMHLLRANGVATNTCRTYLSLVKQLVAAEAEAPKREPTVKRILTVEEIKFLLHVATAKDYTWLAVCLIAGPEALDWKWDTLYNANFIIPLEAYLLIVDEAKARGYKTFDFPFRGVENAHWVEGYERNARIWEMTQHETNRRLKALARRAGIGAANMNITTLRYTQRQLAETYPTPEKTLKALGVEPGKPEPKPKRKEPRLYGIGRRSPAFIERA
jgi:hypothetical protein